MCVKDARGRLSRRLRRSCLGKGDELRIPRYAREPAGPPVFGSLFDPGPAAGDEVPVDVALGLKRFATQKHQTCRPDSRQDDLGVRLEDDQPILAEPVCLTRDLKLTLDDIGGALDM